METVPCPGCAAPLPVHQEVCPACRRPRDQGEIDAGLDALREKAARRKRLPLKVLLWAGLAAAAWGAWTAREAVTRPLAGLRAQLESDYEKARTPHAPEGPISPAAQAVVGAIKTVRGEAAEAPRPAQASPAPAAATADQRPAVRPAEPAEPQPVSRRVYGVVFDLLTARPVAGASVVFGEGTTLESRTTTDSEGHYVVDLPYLPGERLALARVQAPGYAGQLEDAEPTYLERTAAQRRTVFDELSPSDLEPPALRFGEGKHLFAYDMAAVPAK
jgi:hypothetical protein